MKGFHNVHEHTIPSPVYSWIMGASQHLLRRSIWVKGLSYGDGDLAKVSDKYVILTITIEHCRQVSWVENKKNHIQFPLIS